MQDWHEWRAEGIGSSDAAVIMKKFPFGKTPKMLWDEKLNMIIPKQTEAMSHGKKMEPHALEWFEKKMGVKLLRDTRVERPERKWMRATLDGITEDGTVMVEVKSPLNLDNHEKVKKSRKVPDIYIDQCQHAMEAKGIDHMFFMSFNHLDPNDSVVLEVGLDRKYVDMMVGEELKFFQCLVNLTPPELTDKDYEVRGNDWIQIAKSRRDIKKKISDLQKEDKFLCDELIEKSMGKSSCGDVYRFTKIEEKKGRIDYELAFTDLKKTILSTLPEFTFPSEDLYRKDPIVKWMLTERS